MRQIQRALAAALGSIALLAGLAAASSADTPSYYYPPKFAPNGQVRPIYPDTARAARETGVVKIKVLVGANGLPKSFTIFQSSGHKDLDAAVLAACKASKYTPAMKGSTPMTAFYDVSYKFDLQGVEENAGSIGDLQSVVDASPRNSSARVQLADLLQMQQPPDYAHAEATLRAGTSLDPSNANLWSRLGLAYYNDGIAAKTDDTKFKSSVDAFDKALEINPNSDLAKTAAAAYFRYAFDQQGLGQAAVALPYAQKAARIDPKQSVYRMQVGEDEISLGQWQSALSDLTAASALDDHKTPFVTARLLSELGNAQIQSGDKTSGLANIEKAKSVSPSSPFPYQVEYSYYVQQGQYTQALGPLQQLISIQPNDPQWESALGDTYINMSNWTAAQAAYAKALALSPQSGDAQLGIAKVAAAQGKTDQIQAALDAATKASPANASYYNTVIANMLLNASKDKNDYSADALKYAKAGTVADPNNANAWESYAIACADQHQKDNANDALHKAYAIFKAQNNTAGITQVVNYYKTINGTDMPGVDHTDATNRASGPG
jgi:TonB family protein